MAALEVMIILHPTVLVKVAEGTWKGLWNNELVTLCGWENTRILHSELYCAVCQNYEDRNCEIKHFLHAWITGLGYQKLAMSWIMPSLALLLQRVLSMTACINTIRFHMYIKFLWLEMSDYNIYLPWHLVRHSKYI